MAGVIVIHAKIAGDIGRRAGRRQSREQLGDAILENLAGDQPDLGVSSGNRFRMLEPPGPNLDPGLARCIFELRIGPAQAGQQVLDEFRLPRPQRMTMRPTIKPIGRWLQLIVQRQISAPERGRSSPR